ncbi:hypothetical protein [Halodesulfovibrio spirochaetisodalis]|uniref:Uncharacterized protein n=1 Tax=Halodesulfovibrio spirochaetisodalis TaxID=1560234 RepID=A0A1B7X8Z5_9BACT|nr:hypothetical protein [Halodesulfovibrio spirochaetisodalis]OBQ45817.1 hypothetical protein SP90_16120 [Halodesulfovibrio spirochaetisodalis]
MDILAIREHLIASVMTRIDNSLSSRSEALREFMDVTLPNIEKDASAEISQHIPTLPPEVYKKWAEMFADRMLQTVKTDQLADMCDNTEESNATIALVYLMFMESERMEKQIAQDLAALGVQESSSDEVGNFLGDYLRTALGARGEELTEQ